MRPMRERVTAVWLGLLAATAVSTWLLSQDVVGPAAAVVGIFLIAGVKVRYVMLDFMELRRGPLPVRVAFQSWIVVVVALVLGFWFATGPPA